MLARSYVPEIEERLAGDMPKFRRDTLNFVHDGIDRMPDALRAAVIRKWLDDERSKGLRQANSNLRDVTGNISPTGLAMASDDNAIRKKARDRADRFRLLRQHVTSLTAPEQYQVLSRSIENLSTEPPEIRAGVTYVGAVKRMCCERWWRRQLRATHRRWTEAACIRFGSVRRGRSLFVSEDCLRTRREQRRRNDNILKSLIAECAETGEAVSMADIAESTVSNPSLRRNEMMLRMHGMQEWARAQGHSCSFLTVTAPSRYHPTRTKGKAGPVFDNGKFEGSTPRETQAYLSGVWAKVRAELNRQGITVYGVRVAEPHHDATPHWHTMIFGDPFDLDLAVKIYREYALDDTPGEWGRDPSVRFKAKAINWKVDEAGQVVESPVSYIAKYISKNLETADIDQLQNEYSDETRGNEKAIRLDDAIARVDAWRSCWGIRQFQFFGTHAVTIWRELRRIDRDTGPENSEFLPLFEAVNKTEEAGADWQAFMEEMERMPSLRIATEPAEHANAYGEWTKEAIIGLVVLPVSDGAGGVLNPDTAGLFEETRSKHWTVKHCAERDAPWSPVNNCTIGSSP